MRRFAILCLVLLAACSTKTPASPTARPQVTGTAQPESPKFDVQTLLRPGTSAQSTIYGDMDGDGTDEVAVWSRADKTSGQNIIAQSYVDIYANRAGSWTNIYDATKSGVLQTGEDFVSQSISFMRFVKFTNTDLVVGVATQGAGEGPLDVWVLSESKTDFHYQTTRGGQLSVDGNVLVLRTGDYKPSDAMCCPSAIATIKIGATTKGIGIISRTS